VSWISDHHTLKSRAITIFFGIFILSHLASLALFERNRDKTIILTEATDLADRIIGIVNLAHSFPTQDRRKILAAAETQFLTTFPEIISIEEVACQENDFSHRMSNRINSAFDELDGFTAQVCVRSLNTPQLFKTANGQRGFDVLVFINFPDNEQSVFHTILPEGTPLLQDSVVIYIAMVGLFSLFVGWYLIMRSIAPLEQLAKAADEFGENIDKAPMKETGPKELVLAAKAFNRMQDRLATLINSRTEMLAAVSHDLRSAITRLQLRIDLLPHDQEKNGLTRVLMDMRLMVESALAFARGADSQEPLRKVNLTALVESLCEDLKEEGFPVNYHCDTTANLRCRPTSFRRALQNLIDNAIRYGDEAFVEVKQRQNTVLITVADNGPGIPEDQLEKAIKPFYRIKRLTGDDTPGIGLGLTISQNVVNSLGGNLYLKNNPMGGLLVTISLAVD
jgi:signal transduction histidine kinase